MNKEQELLSSINMAKNLYTSLKTSQSQKFKELFVSNLTKKEIIYLYALSQYVQFHPNFTSEDLTQLVKAHSVKFSPYKHMLKYIPHLIEELKTRGYCHTKTRLEGICQLEELAFIYN